MSSIASVAQVFFYKEIIMEGLYMDTTVIYENAKISFEIGH